MFNTEGILGSQMVECSAKEHLCTSFWSYFPFLRLLTELFRKDFSSVTVSSVALEYFHIWHLGENSCDRNTENQLQ